MATKYLLSLSTRHPSALLQQTKRQSRRMGTLAFQYLQSQNQSVPEGEPSWSFTFSSPETAFGAIHSAEMLSMPSPQSDMTSRQDALLSTSSGPLHSAHVGSYSSPPEADVAAERVYAVHQPETAFGYVHSAELVSFASPESDFTAANVSDAVNRRVTTPKPFLDTEFLFSSPESASGYMHASEIISEEMKAEICASKGIEYTGRSREVMFQEFMDAMALMASPESAAGVAPTAMFLDEEARALLFQIQHQVDDLPKTLAEALADPRAVVVTEVVRPFSIVDVNSAWVGLCGYEREEALQKDIGKLLQGPETNHHVARSIVPQLMQEHFANVVLTNYTKQGRRFQNKLKAGLVSDEQGAKYFVGVFEELLESTEGGRMMASASV